MMKRILTALILASGFSFSAAQAAGTLIAGGKATLAQCPILSADTALNTSKGVKAAVNCVELTNSITFGACHTSGSRQAKSTACAQITPPNGATPGVYNNAACTDANYTTTSFDIADFRAYVVGNQGGSVGAKQLGGNCTDSTIAAVIP